MLSRGQWPKLKTVYISNILVIEDSNNLDVAGIRALGKVRGSSNLIINCSIIYIR